MTRKFLFFFFFFFSIYVFSQTEVSGVLAENTTWTLSNSPYIVTGSIMVNESVTLAIEPGVNVKFNALKSMQIKGKIVAIGTNENNIVFTSNQISPTIGDWGNILFLDESEDAIFNQDQSYYDGSILSYCLIEYGSGSSDAVIEINNSSPYIENCIIKNNKGSAISAINPQNLIVSSCELSNNIGKGDAYSSIDGCGIHVNGGKVKIINNTIENNNATGSYSAGGISIRSINIESEILSNTIRNNSATGNDGASGGIMISGNTSQINIESNIIQSNYGSSGYAGAGGGIKVVNNNASVIINSNTIKSNNCSGNGGSGINTGQGGFGPKGWAIISNNNIVNNINGGLEISSDTSLTEIKNNIIYGNTSYGIMMFSGGAIIENNGIIDNSDKGLAIVAYGSSNESLYIRNNFIINNSNNNIYNYDNNILGGNLSYIEISHNLLYNKKEVSNLEIYHIVNTFANNNIITNNSGLGFKYRGPSNVQFNAENNYWNTIIESEIQSQIYDWSDDGSIGNVDYDPYLTSLNIDAPISSPTRIIKNLSGTDVILAWAANTESDIDGYKLYYGNPTGYSYSNVIDLGNVTTYTIVDGDINTEYALTAYDSDADGTDDMVEGNESWYSISEAPPQAPTNFSVEVAPRKARLTWTASTSSDVANYKIYRGTSANSTNEIANIASSLLTYDDTGLTNGTKYYYRMTSVKANGLESDYTSDISVTPLKTWNVSKSGSNTGFGSSSSPLSTIQSAIDYSVNADTVLVQKGTYIENINYKGKNIVVGSLFLTTNDTSNISSTIINGNSAGPVAHISSGETNDAKLIGFSLINGYSSEGAGIYAPNGSPTLDHLIVSNCLAAGDLDGGGGSFGGNTIITNCTFKNNSGRKGGALLLGGNVSVENCFLINNIGGESGSGLQMMTGTFTIKNTVIAGNSGGPTIWCQNCNANIINTTVCNNSSSGYIVYIHGGGNVKFTNSIVYNKNYQEVGSQVGPNPGSVKITYSDVEGGYSGTGNIDSDPFFADIANGNYRLLNYSPLIGLGTSIDSPAIDIVGNPRPNPAGTNPDMGAYENSLGVQANAPPKISFIEDITALEDADNQTINLTGIDDGNILADQNITITATSSDTTLISSPIINYVQTESIGTLTFKPKVNKYGITTITLKLKDNGGVENGGVDTTLVSFKITVTSVNDSPTGIGLSNQIVDENLNIGTEIGTLSSTDVDTNDTHTYTLVSGSGDSDNSSFTITNDKLKSGVVYDFETKSSYSIRIQTKDGNGETFSKSFTITINDVNDSPTEISLSNLTINENAIVGTEVGILTSTDVDTGNTFAYNLVSGEGDTDNGSFTITNDKLLSGESFDFETKASYAIRIQTEDNNGGTFSRSLTITVNDVNESPTGISLSNLAIDENSEVGTEVGTLSATDVDSGNTFTYTLISGDGDTDNNSFAITDDKLLSGEVFDFETKSSYSIRIQTDDGNGGTYSKAFLIQISDVVDPSVTLSTTKNTIAEHESVDIVATIQEATSKDVVINLEFSGTAIYDLDYTTSFATKGTATTVAGGNGQGNNSNQFYDPHDVSVDQAGNIYVADRSNYRIQKWTPGAENGITIATLYADIQFFFVDVSGNIYITDQNNNQIKKWSPEAGWKAVAEQLYHPQGIFVDKDENVYIADMLNNRIQKWSHGASVGITVAGGNGAGSASNQLNRPTDVSVDNAGNIYILDSQNNRIQKWTPGTETGTTITKYNFISSYFNIDTYENVYLSDYYNQKIQKWSNILGWKIVAGGNGQGPAANQFNNQMGLDVDKAGNIYVADRQNQRIQRVQYAPQIVIKAGETTGKLTITGIDDKSDEYDETIIVTPLNATHGILNSTTPLTMTITDNDEPPSISFSFSEEKITENSDTDVILTATLSLVSGKDIEIGFEMEGDAIETEDYVLSSKNITILTGDTTGTLSISTKGLDDTEVEILKSIVFRVVTIVNATATVDTAVLYLDSDDNPSFTLSSQTTAIAEHESLEIKATLIAPTSKDVVIDLEYSGTAIKDIDYTVNSSSIQIAAGETEGQLTIDGIEDDLYNEGNETIIVNVKSAENADITNVLGITITLLDNSKTFTLQGSPFIGLENGAVSWGDYDRDGDLDVAVMGNSPTTGAVTAIYENQEGTFVNTNSNLTRLYYGDISWVDINKDGWIDLVVSGYNGTAQTKLYLNVEGRYFVPTDDYGLPQLLYSKMAWGDLDNDGDIDLAISGVTENENFVFYIYYREDDRDKFVAETAMDTYNWPGFINGDLKIVDIDLDGDNDILFCGENSSGQAVGGIRYNTYIDIASSTSSYKIDNLNLSLKNSTIEVSKFQNSAANQLSIISGGEDGSGNIILTSSNFNSSLDLFPRLKNGDISVADFDNDGLNDIVLTGENQAGVPITKLFLQNSNGTFRESGIQLQGLRKSTANWVDYDMDGDLDLFLTGIDNTGAKTLLYESEIANKKNTPPSIITGLETEDIGNGRIRFTWDTPTDDFSTNLGYVLRLGTTPGGTELSNTESDLSTGRRLISKPAPIYTNFFETQLDPNIYYWSVQAVDQGLKGGLFSEEASFSLTYEWKILNQGGIIDKKITGLKDPVMKLADIDNDDDFDLIYGSASNGGIQLLKFDGKRLVNLGLNPLNVERVTDVEVGDLNGDGKPDILVNNFSWSGSYNLQIYLSNESNYTQYQIDNGLYKAKGRIIDLNNDGQAEVVLIGLSSSLITGRIKVYIYNVAFNETTGVPTFTKTDVSNQIASLSKASFDLGDIDNDQDIDIIMSGQPATSGYQSFIYKNITEMGGNYQFVDTQNNIVAVTDGTSDLIDIDADGDLDALMTGTSTAGDVFEVYMNQPISGNTNWLRLNNLGLTPMRLGKVDLGDFNGDGYSDLLYSGLLQGQGKATKLSEYAPSTRTFIQSSFDVSDIIDAEVEFGDFEGDGDLDFALSGESRTQAGSYIFRAFINVRNQSAIVLTQVANEPTLFKGSSFKAETEMYTVNEPPATPVTNEVNIIDNVAITEKGIPVEFSWQASLDDHTPVGGLTYALKVGTTPGGEEIMSANANANGIRKTAEKGNVEHNLKWRLRLPEGVYYWSVQAIDASYAGSEFSAPAMLDITRGVGFTDVDMSDELWLYPNPTLGKINLEFESIKNRKIKISDLTGRIILMQTLVNKNEMIDLSNFENGIYIISIQEDDKTLTARIVKE